MQNPQYDVTDREPGNNEAPTGLHAIGSSEFLNELWPGLGDEPTYDCQDCHEEVEEVNWHIITLKGEGKEILICNDCLQERLHDDRGYYNPAAIRY